METKDLVLALDLDGTLFYPKHRLRMISKKNLSFLRRFIDGGGHVLLVSGRNRYCSYKTAKKIDRPIDIAGCDAAFIDVNKKNIYTSLIDNKRAIEAADTIKKLFKPTSVFTMSEKYNLVVPKKEFWWLHRFGYRLYDLAQGVYGEKITHSDEILHEELEHGNLYKLMVFFGVSKKAKMKCMSASKILAKKFPDLEFCWINELIEITNAKSTKAEGIKHYLDYLKIKNDNVMVVGDSGNDISMFRNYDNSFCISHAPNYVKKYAKHIINSVDELEDYIDKRNKEKTL